MRKLALAFVLALLSISATFVYANSTGTYCYTHECQTPSLDSGPPYLVNDGDADADDSGPPPPGQIKHVILILDENHSQSSITSSSMPYLTSLGNAYAHTTNLRNIANPSLPNYMALTSGNTNGKAGTDCGTSTNGCTSPSDNIFHQADTAGKGWRGLAQSMGTPCNHNNNGNYVVHHAPAPFYTDIPAATCTASDLVLNPAAFPDVTQAFAFVTPDNLHNAHSGSLGAADAFLKQIIPQIQARADYTDGSTLIEVTFDESGQVYTAFITPSLNGKHLVLTSAYTHYSTLRLSEELLGFPLLGGAATAADLRPALGL